MKVNTFSLKWNQGWECPKCGRVYAPWMTECTKCGNISIGYKYAVNPTTTGNPPNSNSRSSKTDEVSDLVIKW